MNQEAKNIPQQEDSYVLDVEHLTVQYVLEDETVEAVNDISIRLKKGQILGLVGETGAGKTSTALAVLNLVPDPPGRIPSGSVKINGREILKMSKHELEEVRGRDVSMIFQDPMTSLNPVFTVGEQIAESIRLHEKCDSRTAMERAEHMLSLVGIPPERANEYPHQFSGGMKQRVVIAIALSCSPKLLLADEPTTALDVTIQAQVLDMINDLKQKNNTSMILITHDLGVVAQVCDDVAVIYAGQIVERGSKEQVFDHPHHPYTIGLFGAIPSMNVDEEYLHPIDGLPPDPSNLPKGCPFNPRCPYATDACRQGAIGEVQTPDGHWCRCVNLDQVKEGAIKS